MPNIWETQIDQDTPDDLLEQCALYGDHHSGERQQISASKAKAELKRRDRHYERTQWQERFNAESKERIKGQQFQEAQTNRQLEIANKILGITKLAALAASASAIAAIALVILAAGD